MGSRRDRTIRGRGGRARRFRASVVVLGLLVAILVAGTWRAVVLLMESNDAQHEIRHVARLSSDALRYQLDEETGLRGFVLTHRRTFLEPYREATTKLDGTLTALSAGLERLGVPSGPATVATMRRIHADWIATVVRPSLTRPSRVDVRIRGKTLVDRYRTACAQLVAAIDARAAVLDERSRSQILRLFIVVIFVLVVFALFVAWLARRQSGLERELDREQDIVTVLQGSLQSTIEAPPGVSMGNAYVSATRDASVGGDFFDVRSIDESRGYFLIGDVSGKGVDAAVDTAMIRYGINALAQGSDDPGQILRTFNAVFTRSRANGDSFVVAFLAMCNPRTLTLRYASAGHAQAYLRRGRIVEPLKVTGPIVGVIDDAEFGVYRLSLKKNDLIVLATDGLTEARNAAGEMLDDAGAMAWIASSDARTPQELADELVSRLRTYVGGVLRDDLAILTFSVTDDAAAAYDDSSHGLARDDRPGDAPRDPNLLKRMRGGVA